MSDALNIEGKEYISSKRAAELSGYAQDYIGQISRKGLIEAQRIGGLWYVSMDSLTEYKQKAEAFEPTPPQRKNIADPDSLINFDGKDYISASRAAQITGYHQDYVSQLARAGTIMSRQVGNRWYVEREGIQAHKKEKDALLAAVQADSVGLRRGTGSAIDTPRSAFPFEDHGPKLIYTSEKGDLIPLPRQKPDDQGPNIPIRRSAVMPARALEVQKKLDHKAPVKPVNSGGRRHGKALFYGTLAASALTIVIVLSFGFSVLNIGPVYTIHLLPSSEVNGKNALTASSGGLFATLGDTLEKYLVTELIYDRSKKDF